MTRAEVEMSTKISATGKLILEWLSRQPNRVHSAKEIALALGSHAAEIAEVGYQLRRLGFTIGKHEGMDLQQAMLILSPTTRAAYCGDKVKKVAA